MMLVAERFRDSGEALNTNGIAEKIGVPGLLLTNVRERLCAAGLLETGRQDKLIPARDPASISVADVLQAVRGAQDSDVYQGGNWPQPVRGIFAAIDESAGPQLRDCSLYDLVKRA